MIKSVHLSSTLLLGLFLGQVVEARHDIFSSLLDSPEEDPPPFFTTKELSKPIKITPRASACLNSRTFSYFYENKQRQCANVRLKEGRRQEMCQFEDVRENCPQSCGICCEVCMYSEPHRQ